LGYSVNMWLNKTVVILVVFTLLACDDDSSKNLCDDVICGDLQRCAADSGICVSLCHEVVCEGDESCDLLTGECRLLIDDEQGEEYCSDNIDNDGDGAVDCDDSGCFGQPHCMAETGQFKCSDNIDNDSDQLIDCDDPDCSGEVICNQESDNITCSDNIDNDSDGAVDCDDEDCQVSSVTVCSEPLPNEGWIGGNCDSLTDCDYDDAICLDGIFSGMCSLPCDLYCPDSTEENHSITFCTDNPQESGSGICVSRCDYLIYPQSGCEDGLECVMTQRFNEPTTTQSVCLPPGENPAVCSENDVPQPNVGIISPQGIDGCPGGMKPISGGTVCMDIWEAHIVEVLAPGSYLPHSPFFNPGTKTIMAISAPGAVPQGYITQIQAQAACTEAGKRLCSNDEWELACRTTLLNTYPYGNTRQPGWCNDARTPHPVVEYFGTSDSWIWSELGHPCINQLDNSLDLTGSNTQCVTSEGFFDLMGNLHEWTSDPAGTFKGGYYVDTVINGNGCLYQTTAHNTQHWDYSTGFRCCADK
jgi:Sulfatase-modifying factor enzyme 1